MIFHQVIHLQVKPGLPPITMPRKSARLLSKSKLQSQDTDADHQPPKRRKMEDVENRGCMASQKRQQFRIQNKWLPISRTTAITSCMLIRTNSHTSQPAALPLSTLACPETLPLPGPAGDQENYDSVIHTPGALGHSLFRFSNHFRQPAIQRSCPLPALNWVDAEEMWQAMLKKEDNYRHSHCIFNNHPQLQSRMRPVLFEWMMEVCEVYRLHRETLYLAMDFIDRYLQAVSDVPKTQLQLLGVSALFVASKLEEIYPPKTSDFAYVTDGACTEEDIKNYEIVLCKALKWELSPMTANNWLLMYLQLINLDLGERLEAEKENDLQFVEPLFSADVYLQVARLLDLCMWDVDCLQFNYSVLAAAALHHLGNIGSLLGYTGLNWNDLVPCVQWMAPFVAVVRTVPPAQVKFFQSVKNDDAHNIQTKTVTLALYDRAIAIQTEGGAAGGNMAYPGHSQDLCDYQGPAGSLVTPPRSTKKSTDMEH